MNYLNMDLWWEKVAVEDSFGVEGRHNLAVSFVDGHQEVRQQTLIETQFSTFLKKISVISSVRTKVTGRPQYQQS